MESFIMLYIIFALTTALAASFNILKPVLFSLAIEQPENPLVEYRKITYFTFIVLAILMAPIMFLPTIFPGLAEIFKTSLLKSIKD